MYQRQLSKEGLQSLVNSTSDAGAVSSNMPVNSMSSEDLRNLFSLRAGTLSDTYDSVCCRFDLMHSHFPRFTLLLLLYSSARSFVP